MGNQFPIANITKEEQMQRYHFKRWGDSFKCFHCPKREENRYHALHHFKKNHKHRFDNIDPTYGETWCSICGTKNPKRGRRSMTQCWAMRCEAFKNYPTQRCQLEEYHQGDHLYYPDNLSQTNTRRVNHE